MAGVGDYGSLTPLVERVTWAAGAAGAILAIVLPMIGKWEPSSRDLPKFITKPIVLLFSGLVILWTAFRDPAAGRDLTPILELLAAGFVAAMLLYIVVVLPRLVNRKYVATAGGPVKTERVLGGLWLDAAGRDALRTYGSREMLLHHAAGDKASVWSGPSRTAAVAVFLVVYWVLAGTGSGAAAVAAIQVMRAEQPSIRKFTLSQLKAAKDETIWIDWDVANAEKVHLDPFPEDVPRQGHRPDQVTENRVYTLRASNKFGEQGSQLGVEMAAAPQVKTQVKSGARTTPAPNAAEIVFEARDCALEEDVVIRGDGWLQSENDTPHFGKATCRVNLPQRGRYQMFVDYAADGSYPVQVVLNKELLQNFDLGSPSGGWNVMRSAAFEVRTLPGAVNTLVFTSEHLFPHIRRIRFVRL